MSNLEPDPAPSVAPGGRTAMSAAIRRDIRRANTAVAAVLAAVLALAIVAVFAGLRAKHNQRRAETAEAANQDRLRIAYTEAARAWRLSGDAGSLASALTAISNAVVIRVSPELRTEAMACLALADLAPEGPLVPTARDLTRLLVDPQFHYYAYGDATGKILVNSLASNLPSLVFNPEGVGSRGKTPPAELDFSPDGTALAACLADGTVAVWSLTSGRAIFSNAFPATSLFAPIALRGVEFSADSTRLIFSDPAVQGQISVYNLVTGLRERTGVAGWGKTYRLRPDFHAVAMVTDTGAEILNFPDGKVRQTVALSAPVVTLEWSPDGRHVALALADGEICLWEPESGTQKTFAGHSEAGIRLGFNPAGTLFFSTSRDGSTRLWDVALGRMAAVGRGFACTFSTDGRRIMFWKPWSGFGIWRVAASRVYAVEECDKTAGPLYSVDLSASGRWCVVTQGKGVRLWDLANGARESYFPTAASGARVTVDEQALLVCETNGLTVWPLTTNADGLAIFSPDRARSLALPDGQGARAVTLSGDGRWAVVELRDRRLARICLEGRQPGTVLAGRWGHNNTKGAASSTGAGRFAVSPDGHWIVTGFDFAGDDPKVWSGETGALVANLATGTSVAGFSRDGHWLGLAGISRNSLWSVGDWKLQKEFPRQESSLVHGALAFLPGEPVMALSQTRQVVQLRNWETDEPVGDLIPPEAESVNSMRISADGQTLVMATASDRIEVWRLGELRRELAAMSLDWKAHPEKQVRPSPDTGGGLADWPLTLPILAGFGLIAFVALLTLRRHRQAIERFVTAEAEAVGSHRALNLANVELMHSQKMQALGTLAAGVAHDFNNLLSVIRMSNTLIGRQARRDPEVQELVGDIEQAVVQGKNVVGSVLGCARAGRESDGPTDVSAVIEETVSLLSREFMSGIALTLDLERNAPLATIARGPLEQVFVNLVVNASEAMAGRGRLAISLKSHSSLPDLAYLLRPAEAAQYLELSVLDGGPGIAPELQNRLFEPFFTTKVSGAKVGTGLGLSLVYSIAQHARLGLTVASTLGEGARFTIVIPVAPLTVREMHTGQTPEPT